MTWTDQLRKVNRLGGMCIAHLHPGDVATSFQQSLMNTMALDARMYGRLTASTGKLHLIATQAGAGTIDKARNQAVEAFLHDPTYSECDRLLFIDSDMGWEPDAPERLCAVMDDLDLSVVGGLCFSQKIVGVTGRDSTPDIELFPTLYRWSPRGAFDTAFDYPPDAVIEVGATGGAFILISRKVLEDIGSDWFTPTTVEPHPKPFGEDMSFCIRAKRAGHATHVHTGVRITHKKEHWITEDAYKTSRAPASAAVTVVIPVKDRFDLTRTLIGDLVGQGGYSDILIFDNGSTDPEMVEWLATQDVADVYSAPDANIHEMWNAGMDEAVNRHGGMADVVVLNNDLRAGPRFLRRLITGLRSDRNMMAVSGNYDGRPGTGTMPLRGICANRYDGTGGLAGFAFALKAEWVARYRFPTEMAWWYGDNDLCLSIEKAGGWYGMALDALVEHVGGGSQTETPDGWDEQLVKDRAAFEAKWPTVTLVNA